MFRDRAQAGERLARELGDPAKYPGALVLALPRGGVPVAAEIADELKAPLDVFLVRKLGFPGNPELAMGAIASGGGRVLNQELIHRANIADSVIEEVVCSETAELARREQLYRQDAAPLAVAGKSAILVDDGIATGATMLVAIQALKNLRPARIVVATPTIAAAALERVAPEADEVIAVVAPDDFSGVGWFYRDFDQTTDAEVLELLARHRGTSYSGGDIKPRFVLSDGHAPRPRPAAPQTDGDIPG